MLNRRYMTIFLAYLHMSNARNPMRLCRHFALVICSTILLFHQNCKTINISEILKLALALSFNYDTALYYNLVIIPYTVALFYPVFVYVGKWIALAIAKRWVNRSHSFWLSINTLIKIKINPKYIDQLGYITVLFVLIKIILNYQFISTHCGRWFRGKISNKRKKTQHC